MTDSFAMQTKADLCAVFLKQNCCKRAFVYGALFGGGDFSWEGIRLKADLEVFASLFVKMLRSAFGVQVEMRVGEPMTIDAEGSEKILLALGYVRGEDPTRRIVTEALKCEYDNGVFLRGVFLACGTVNMPDSSYHLELVPPCAHRLEALRVFLTDCDIEPKVIKRTARREESLYYKDSTAMEDFLNLIGAQRAAFKLMNVKIMRDIRNNANRVANCDMANIDKSIAASARQMEAIWRIAEEGRTEDLPRSLRQTFDLRAAYPDLNLVELGALHDPPLSKSGVSHRLAKIIAFSEQGKDEE